MCNGRFTVYPHARTQFENERPDDLWIVRRGTWFYRDECGSLRPADENLAQILEAHYTLSVFYSNIDGVENDTKVYSIFPDGTCLETDTVLSSHLRMLVRGYDSSLDISAGLRFLVCEGLIIGFSSFSKERFA